MIPAGVVRDTPQGAVIAIRVTPRARRSAWGGLLEKEDGAMLKVALQAPPVDGRANEALLDFLALQLEVPPSALEITRGMHSREKLVRVSGASAQEVTRQLERLTDRGAPVSYTSR